MLAGLPYVVWPVGSLFILASRKKDDPFLHYHAVQGGLFGAAMSAFCLLSLIALAIAFRLLPGSSTYLPGMLGMGVLFGGGLLATMIFFMAIFLGWRATEGEMIRLPFAGDFAEGKMLDHTGMTRREFLEMLEKSFIEPNPNEPEPIPFPAYGTPAVSGKAAEVLAQRPDGGATPASQKAAEILAHRQAKQAAAQQAQAAQQAALQASQQAANLAAKQAAALLAAQQAAQRPAAPPARPTAQQQPPKPVQTPTPAARPPAVEDGRAKSYPLIGGSAGGNVLQPSPPQRSAQPPQKSQSPSGWQQSPGQGQPSMPPSQGSPGMVSNPQVKEVDLVRHYKERRTSAQQQTEALRDWLSAVDDG